MLTDIIILLLFGDHFLRLLYFFANVDRRSWSSDRVDYIIRWSEVNCRID